MNLKYFIMDNKILHSDSNVEYHLNLLSSLEQISSLVNKSISTIKAQLNNSSPNESELPCHTYTRQTQKCSEHCEALNAHLDGANKGKLHGERTSNIDFDRIGSLDSSDCADSHSEARSLDRRSLAKIQKVTAFDPSEPYQTCWDSLSLMQRKVIQLHLGEGIKQKDIAKKLKKSPSTISNHLSMTALQEFDTSCFRCFASAGVGRFIACLVIFTHIGFLLP